MTLAAFAFAAVSLFVALLPVLAHVARPMLYDDRPAVVIHEAALITPVVAPGGTIRFVSLYDKRAECHPPLGGGEAYYRLFGSPDSAATRHNIFDFDLRRETRWPPGQGQRFESSLAVPRDVPPGRYIFRTFATYRCHGASAQQHIEGPPLTLTVELAR